ncbi:hypothetical protein [Chitinophaga filiformis]|uniref:Uncharacterized protein n=1 Tax=Chitinophaga filiformis TaxID=104663 RepID=A0ABY4HWI1_CHIFI|nr:hypothetical protein [Chitinophaga filiformis]UPK67960.1 hypothetical protein MYF79_23695 [Chitinophaga filiformis]
MKNKHAFQLILYIVLILSILLIVSVLPGIDLEGPIRISPQNEGLRSILIVLGGGAMGSTLRAILSMSAIIYGNIDTGTSLPFYFQRAFTGLSASLIVYFIFKGLLLSPNTPAQYINFSGILVLSIMSGFFADEFLRQLTASLYRLVNKDARVDEKINNLTMALGIDILDNYDGKFCFFLTDTDGNTLIPAMSTRRLTVTMNREYILHWYLRPKTETENQDSITEDLIVSGGKTSETVTFTIVPHLNAQRLAPREQTVSFPVHRRSETKTIPFSITTENERPDLWLEIFQKNRLISVINVNLNFEEAPNSSTLNP